MTLDNKFILLFYLCFNFSFPLVIFFTAKIKFNKNLVLISSFSTIGQDSSKDRNQEVLQLVETVHKLWWINNRGYDPLFKHQLKSEQRLERTSTRNLAHRYKLSQKAKQEEKALIKEQRIAKQQKLNSEEY